jgi:hypothetical protein
MDAATNTMPAWAQGVIAVPTERHVRERGTIVRRVAQEGGGCG